MGGGLSGQISGLGRRKHVQLSKVWNATKPTKFTCAAGPLVCSRLTRF